MKIIFKNTISSVRSVYLDVNIRKGLRAGTG